MNTLIHKRRVGTDFSSADSAETFTLDVKDIARGGAGVARAPDGRVVFVPYTAPGDRIRAQVNWSRRRYGHGRLLEILQPSPIRIEPRCPAFGRCGGCDWQHLPYEKQWEIKVSGVRQALSRPRVNFESDFEEFPADSIWEYRNRVQLRTKGETIGYFASGSRELVAIEDCPVARPEINAALPGVRAEAARRGGGTHKVELDVPHPDGPVRRMWDAPHAALGFRQIHDEQNRKLRRWVEACVPDGTRVFDLYGGAGNLSLGLKERAKSIDVVDISAKKGTPERDVRFHPGPVLPWLLKEAARSDGRPDTGGIAVLDPPRQGVGRDIPEFIGAFAALGIDRLIAVGCDTDAWATDLRRWIDGGWKLQRAAVFDFFPQTRHVESVAFLEAAP